MTRRGVYAKLMSPRVGLLSGAYTRPLRDRRAYRQNRPKNHVDAGNLYEENYKKKIKKPVLKN